MTTFNQTPLPRTREINNSYYSDQTDWCARRLIKHIMITVGMIAILLITHGAGLITLPAPLMILGFAVPLIYLLVATRPHRLEAKFQSTHPYSDYADPRDR